MKVKITVKDKLEDDTLDLSCCDLETVPVKEIAAVKKGTHLDLSNNQIDRLPDTFITLTHIVKLDLSKNLLEELPENIGELKQLKHLDLYSNKISRLPLSFGELKNLKWLDLKDNPLNNVLSLLAGPCSDKEECQKCAANIIVYYEALKKSIAEKKILAMIEADAEEQKPAKRRKKKKKGASKDSNHSNDEKEKVASSTAEEPILSNDIKHTAPEMNSKLQAVDKTIAKGGLCSTLCQVLLSLVIVLLFLLVVFVLFVTILPKFDEKSSDKLVYYLEKQTGYPVKHYQRLGTTNLDSVVEYTSSLMNYTRILVRKTYERYFVEKIVDDGADL